jgi:Fe-S cluster biogenesis protein NfuA/nitrite reductase/ring-hydroxylating ferredoxin subunit
MSGTALVGKAALSLDAMTSDILALEELAADWTEPQRQASEAHARAVDALNAEAFRRLIRRLEPVPGISAALRDAVSDEVVYAVLRRHGILKPSLHERVDAALATVRPMLASHGGSVELVAVNMPAAEVRLLGACDGCPASALTFYAGVKKAIQDLVPEITDVRQVKGLGQTRKETPNFTSPFATAQSDDWVSAGLLTDLPNGCTRIVQVGGHSVLLSRFGDVLTCFENACAHMGMPMEGGDIADGHITCSEHGFHYALNSGACLTAPDVQLRAHGVRIVGERVDLRLER